VGAPDGGKAVKPEGWGPPVVPVVPLPAAAHAGAGGAGRA